MTTTAIFTLVCPGCKATGLETPQSLAANLFTAYQCETCGAPMRIPPAVRESLKAGTWLAAMIQMESPPKPEDLSDAMLIDQFERLHPEDETHQAFLDEIERRNLDL